MDARSCFSSWRCKFFIFKLIASLIAIAVIFLSPRNYCGNGNWVLKPFTCDNECGRPDDSRICPKDFNVTQNIPLKLEDQDIIQSPNFPRFYPPNLNTLWNVTTAPGYRIRVVFRFFELEDSADCENDYLSLHDGADLYAPVLGTFCRHTEGSLPEPVMSSSNSLVLHFKTNNFLDWTGFELALFTDPRTTTRTGDQGLNIRTTTESPPASRNIPVKLEDEAVIRSPEFPDHYPPSLNMLWNVTTAPGHRIRVVFTAFDLEDSADCIMDYLTLHDGINLYSAVLQTLCGHLEDSLPRPITSSSNSLVLHFRTDKSISLKGFKLALSTVCGGTLQAGSSENVLVSHPKYGRDSTASNLTCDWILMSGPERNVQISFSDFDMAKPSLANDNERLPKKIDLSGCENSISGNCVPYYEDSEADGPKDFVEIFDGPDDTSSRIGKYYSNRMPTTTITSRGEKLLVRFRSGVDGRYRGFRAVYKEV